MNCPRSHVATLAVLAVLGLTFSVAAQPIPNCYHSPMGIDTFLQNLLALDTRGYVDVDTIGYSRDDCDDTAYPIYAVTISDNATVYEDEPTALIIGHIHAEEMIGLEVTLAMMRNLIVNWWTNRVLIENTQMVFVPTMNPFGLEIVTSGVDRYYRKNCYVPPQLPGGECHYVDGPGDDSCGVDLNRNFDINWIYGDTLGHPGGGEPFDYYRGPYAASEPETQAIADYARQIRPTVSAVFHSSRQGGNAERGIAPWEWGEEGGPTRVSPDCTAIGFFNRNYCAKFTGRPSGYHVAFGSKRNGNLQDWFYRELGCIQINTELGPPYNIQPPCDTLSAIMSDDLEALGWMLRRTMNLRQPSNETGMTPVVIHTYDAATSLPISAEWRNMNTWNAYLRPWYTSPQYGSATTLLAPTGQVLIHVRKEGYVPRDTLYAVPPNSDSRYLNLHLQPLPWHTLTLRLRDENAAPLAGRVFLGGEYPRWLDVAGGDLTLSVPEGDYYLIAEATTEDRLILWRNVHIAADHAEWFSLPQSAPVFSETFSDGGSNWTMGGTGSAWRIAQDTSLVNPTAVLTTVPASADFRAQYAPNLNAWAAYSQPVALGSGNTSVLSFYRRGRMDMPFDSLIFEVSPDGANWIYAAGFSDDDISWTQGLVNLSAWAGQEINFRFRFKTDVALGDLGIAIDHIKIFTGIDSAAPERPEGKQWDYRVTGAYPNPFNPTTTITYEVAAPGDVRFVLYNTLGEEVRRFDIHAMAAGAHRLRWNGTAATGAEVASGLYFMQMQAAGKVSTQKLLLIR